MTACFLHDICSIFVKRNLAVYSKEKPYLEADQDYFIGHFLLNIRIYKTGIESSVL
jgi:hypothetical protein